MAENNQLSDETKNNSTDTSSTDASSAVIGNHENAIVPHKISNHDKLVQTMVMVDGEWINVNDTNDQANMKEDVHKVNKKVVEAQKGIVEAKNAADSAVKYADSAVSASKVNSDAIVAQSSAISEAKAATDSATAEVQQLKANAASDAASIRADVAAASETLTGQGKQIATINTTLDGLNTKYEGFSDNLSKLSGAVAINSTQIGQNKKSIALKADQATVDNLSGEVSRNTAQLKVQADQISSKVSSEDFSALDNKVGSAIAQIDKNTTAIDQTNKQISLKADQTEVDNVKSTAQQNSSRLDVMADQIKSKVTSTDVNNIVDGKGYATQNTVQSLIDQKAGTINESITNLDAKYKAKDGVNLATKTGNVSLSGGYNSNKNIGYISLDAINDLCGKYMTISVDVEWSGWKSGNQNRLGYELQINYDDGSTEYDSCWLTPTTANGKQRVTATYKIKDQHVKSLGEGNAYIRINCTSAKVSHLKIERGTVATPWTPAPSDNATVTQLQSVTASIDGLQSAVKNKVDQSQYTQLAGVVQTKVSQSDFNRLDNQVNVQTLDSADINNMKANGHYFVHNLANNPIGGWVYVDVTGNGNDRIRQDVYQDSGTKHAFRRWFGSYWTEWSTGAEESEITQLRNDINLRVKSGDLLSQINIAAGHTLIQSNKIYFDADSFVMSPNSKAFIPSAYITNINADKINTGTLRSITINNGNGTFRVDPDGNVYANSMHVNNGSIYQGTVLGADVYSISNLTSNSLDEVNDATQDWVKLKDGIIELHGANGDHYSSIVPIDVITKYSGDGGSTDVHHGLGILDSREVIIGSASLDSEYSNRITHSRNFDLISRTQLGITDSYIQAQLDPDVEYGKGARFSIQKDNKVGFYVGVGDKGNEIQIAGFGPIKLQGRYIDDGFDDGITHSLGNLQVDNLHVKKWLGVDNNKNAIVKTSQGTVAINAYETAEYYFGDIGEGQTDSNGVAYVGIEKLFNETVNTSIPYQVFITAYGPGNVWVEQREQDRFMVKSSQPNIKFGWEIKAKRKGYEHTRLQNVDNKLNHMAATS